MTREELIAKIQNATESDKDFQEIVAVVIDNGFLTEMEVAREFGCSRPTVQRWKTGINAPLPGMRRVVYNCLTKKLLKQLNRNLNREEIIAKIRSSSTEDDSDFQEVITSVIDGCFFTELTLAEFCTVAIPTVRRWKSGENSPHPFVRQAFFDQLLKHFQATT